MRERVRSGVFSALVLMAAVWPSVAFAHVVYVSNDSSANITVIETTSNTVIATIDTSPYHVQNAVVSPDGASVYFAGLSTTGAVVVVDTATNAVSHVVPLPDGVQP